MSPLEVERNEDPSTERGLLKDQAFDALREMIVSGSAPPGVFLSERRLAAQLGMSKTPVKAALERLETEGYIRVSPQQGIIVRELAVEDVIDLFDIRLALEPFVARRIAGRLTTEQEAKLADNLGAQERATAAGDRDTYRKRDTEFHYLLCEFQGNREILRVMSHLQDRLYRAMLRVLVRVPGRMASGLAEHRHIAAAISAGDGESAATALTAHLEFGRRMLVEPTGTTL